MHLILSIAHSNASDETLFSIIRKNRTEFRPSLNSRDPNSFWPPNPEGGKPSQRRSLLSSQVQWQSFGKVQSSNYRYVICLVDTKPLDIVELEFLQYQVDPLLNVSLDKRADEVWTEIRTLKDHVTDKLKYDNLEKLMHAILALYRTAMQMMSNSSALYERIQQSSGPVLKPTTLSDILKKKN